MNFQTKLKQSIQITLAASSALLLTACGSTSTQPGIDYAAEFSRCTDEGVMAQEQANGNSAGYLHSARILDACLIELVDQKAVPQQEQMQVRALATLNYVKAGDIESASRSLSGFESDYTGRDLFFDNGASFLDSMRLLLGQLDSSAALESSWVNASPELKAELRRVEYWASH